MYSFGIKKARYGVIDAVTGLVKDWKEIQDIYKDTCDFKRSAATKKEHYSQQSPDQPKVVFNKKAVAELKFSVMRTDADEKKIWLGGTVTTLDGRKVWNEPATTPTINYGFEFETTDGQLITIYKGSTSGAENFEFRDDGILLIDVVITPLLPDVAGLPSTSSADPKAVA